MRGWRTEYLADIADFCLGKMLDEKKNRGEPLPYLANINVRWGEFDLDNVREMRFEPHEIDRYGLKHGDIVMCEGGEPGRCAVWKDDKPGMMIQKALHRIRPHDCLDNRFLYYSFLNKGKIRAFAPLFTGATIKHLPRQNLAKIEIRFPPRVIQENIADILSSYDDLIENNRRRIQLLEEAARLLYKEWFVNLRFPGHEHVKIVDGVPEGWETKRLQDLAEITMGQSPESKHYNDEGIGLPFHQGVTNFGTRFPTDKNYCSVEGRIAEPGDVLFSVRAPVGRINVTLSKIVIGRGLASIRSNCGRQTFLFYQLKNHFFREDMIGAGAIFAAITKKDLYQVKLLSPPRQLSEIFRECVLSIDCQIETLHKTIERLSSARDLLLPRLMNGEIRL